MDRYREILAVTQTNGQTEIWIDIKGHVCRHTDRQADKQNMDMGVLSDRLANTKSRHISNTRAQFDL
jgi:hypothetical protein